MPAATTRAGRRLSALWETDPDAARNEVLVALAACEQDVPRAAQYLGVSRRTLFRWLKIHPSLREVHP